MDKHDHNSLYAYWCTWDTQNCMAEKKEKNRNIMKYYLAIDIGATSGRHIVGDERGNLTEVYRFKTGFTESGGSLINDIGALWNNVLQGIKQAFVQFPQIESLAIDTWGCDYVLMDGEKEILPVYAYRDKRTAAVTEEAHQAVPFEELYERTGIQFQPFNTVYQLYADMKAGRLERATDFFMLPEYLTYKLTGVKTREYTNATTTGLVNVKSKEYDQEIIHRLGLPERLFPKLQSPKTVVGQLKETIAKEVGGQTKVILCATHDTASAVAGIPMSEENPPYISSGTWSLLGVKSPVAITTGESRKQNWSNEGGVGYIRYQKNIMGMWVVNRLKDELCPEKTFREIDEEAQKSTFYEFLDVNDRAFLSPKSMKEAFDQWFADEKRKPESIGDYFRCAYTSLAMNYVAAIEELQRNTDRRFEEIVIVGGGAKNKFLNRLTEEAAKIKVIALPIEATALGNIKIQQEAGNECL